MQNAGKTMQGNSHTGTRTYASLVTSRRKTRYEELHRKSPPMTMPCLFFSAHAHTCRGAKGTSYTEPLAPTFVRTCLDVSFAASISGSTPSSDAAKSTYDWSEGTELPLSVSSNVTLP